ncbi:TraR/DksA family transcriptional regulator [Emcibacter nanhaiensis]|uniref:TraR/DksA family transcriptional regulator n=1 Tax=Emcibacter nanhaiensis TaxID=1505037 RepID=A0A501PA81_9PROT|nr:TraR/DksA C4-type zinc finger protein [Emcibacter nanhaiensis]TPD57253.1 TraR/DksA family transcriptional regulator [Emcibacter nanhaiensis]
MDIEIYRQKLLEMKKNLEELLAISEDGRATVELDQSKVGRLSRMNALQAQAMSKEVTRRRLQELRRIESALARMEEDEFGFCLTCGEEIEQERLALDPSVTQCQNCAR